MTAPDKSAMQDVMLRLTLVRHGQTACSVKDVYCGRHCDPSLTQAGRLMAEQLRQALAGTPFDAMYTSPLVRAQQTLWPVAQAHGHTPTLVPALAELDYGDWDGAQAQALVARVPEAYAAWHKAPSRIAPPGGETVTMLWRRTRRALGHIIDAHMATGKPQHVLVVSHKSTLRVALCGLLGVELDRYRERFAWPLGAMAQVDLTASGPHLVRLGDTQYQVHDNASPALATQRSF